MPSRKRKGTRNTYSSADHSAVSDDSESSSTEEEAVMSSKAMEAFLEAQTKFLEQQQKFAAEEEARKADLHQAQLKELQEREKLLKLQEEQSTEAKTQRDAIEKAKQKTKQADRMEKWHDGDQADAYLAKFETVMTECDIPHDQWRGRLINCLTGRALTAYRSVAAQDSADKTFGDLKDRLLEAMGLGIEQTRRKFWNPGRKLANSPLDMLRQLDSSYSRITRECSTPELLRQEMLIGRLLSLYPTDIADYVYLRTPTNAHQAAQYLQNYLDTHPWKKNNLDHPRPKVSGFGGGMGGGGDSGNNREYSHGSRKEPYYKGKDYRQGRDDGKGKEERSYKRDPPTFIPTCHGCGVKGHIRPECPNKAACSVRNAGHSRGRTVPGRVGDNPCMMTLDSGADHTVVRADLVTDADYTGRCSRVGDYYGCWRDVPTANVWLGIKHEYLFKHEVLVVPRDCPHEVLLGNDLDIFDDLYEVAMSNSDSDPRVKVVTRQQAQKQEEQDAIDKALDARDGALPIVVESPKSGKDEVPQEQQDIAERKVEQDEEDVKEDEEYEEGVRVDGLDADDEGAPDLPLPDMAGGEGDRKQLIEEQSNDDTLKDIRKWAEKGEKGYAYDHGLLVHVLVTPSEQVCSRIVVPTTRRAELLKLAHSSMLGGHFSHGKTTELLNRRFTWPRMSVDVKTLCSQCVPCQKASRARIPKAPLQPLPVLDVPFSKLAFDLVGPLPRTKSGYKYLLTSICLASKYPDAIPLKRVDVETVAEGLCEIFSRTGIPTEILTDQGSVFTSKLTKQLCSILNIKHVKSSPYHPESNGCLERWHSTLKGTLRKYPNKTNDWDRLIKYILFACRAAPHANTGYSPFELVFGRQLRGPLDVVHEGWMGGDLPQSSTVQWIDQLREKLALVWEVAVGKEERAKDQMALRSERHSKIRQFSKGDQVLVRVIDPGGKLGDRWDGPYEVETKVADVTYRLAVPHRRKKCMTAHVNRLKAWNAPDASVLRVVVADEEPEMVDKTESNNWRSLLEPHQLADIEQILADYKPQTDGSFGEAVGLVHEISTEGHDPSWTPPHRIAPAWRAPLKDEVRAWLEQGIIKPSNSPWSSPVVPVRKPDGSLRLCIDYRALNKITTPDPYPIPRIDDLIDELNDAKYLTKIDLNKGFLQIPVHPKDQPKTAFQTPWGKYEFTRMPFGLMNAPSTFQRSMNIVLQGNEQFANCYIDDIVVHSKTWEDHVKHIRTVLEQLKQFGLTANPKKCVWGVAEIEYLGYMVGRGKVSIPQLRVKALREYKRPMTKKDLKSYLGMLGYYRRFIPGFSSIALPLTEATSLKSPNQIRWTQSMESAFNTLRDTLCDHTQLTIPSPEDCFLLATDASGKGIGAVLSVTRSGAHLPVAYFSRKLTGAEHNYAITELECLALVKAVEHFGHYLVGRHFVVTTDHKALEALQTSKRLTGRLARWALSLQHLSYTVQYKAGATHQNADGLSRQSWENIAENIAEDANA